MLPADQGSQFCSAVGRQQRANNDSHRAGECLLLALSGHGADLLPRPLSGAKRTRLPSDGAAANDAVDGATLRHRTAIVWVR